MIGEIYVIYIRTSGSLGGPDDSLQPSAIGYFTSEDVAQAWVAEGPSFRGYWKLEKMTWNIDDGLRKGH